LRLVCVLVSAGSHLPAAAAETPPALDLPSAIRLAREGNPSIRRSSADAGAARAAKREAKLQRLPVVTAREIAVRTTSPADVFGLELQQERFSFPAFTAGNPNDPDALDNFTTELEVRLPLFTGGALSAGIRQASRMADAAAAIERHTTRAVELGVTEAYLGVLLAGRFVALAEEARATTARHVADADAFFETGMIVESDLLRAKVQLARMEENLVRARNGERIARAGLNHAMGVEQGRAFTLLEPAPASDPMLSNLDEALARAKETRADLFAGERQVEAAKAAVSQARAGYLPAIGIAARWDWNDDRPFGTNGDNYSLVARAEWDVWNFGLTRARVTRGKNAHLAAIETQRDRAGAVELDVRRAWHGVEEARARRAATAGAV
jgi:outer membrane protein TolC